MMALAFPAGANACSTAKADLSLEETCHEEAGGNTGGLASDLADLDHQCACAMHQIGHLPVSGGMVLRADIMGPDGLFLVPVLKGLGILPLSPPPNPQLPLNAGRLFPQSI